MQQTPAVSKKKVIVVGGGGHAAVVLDSLHTLADAGLEIEIAGVLDDAPFPDLLGVPRVGALQDWCRFENTWFHVAIGNAALREKLCSGIGASRLLSVVHPRAVVSRHAQLAAGCFVGACAVVNAGAVLENGSIVNSGAIVEHHARVGAYAHVSYGGIVCGGASVVAGATVPSGFVVERGRVFGE